MKKNLIILIAILCFGMLTTLMLLITAHIGKQNATTSSSSAISNAANSETSDSESEKEAEESNIATTENSSDSAVVSTTESWQEYKEILQEKRRESLTPEEEAAGYQIINGMIYSPEEIAGDSGMISINASDIELDSNAIIGTAFFSAIPDHIDVALYSVFFINKETGQQYYIELYTSNNFESTVYLPTGTYYLSDVQSSDEYMSMYAVDYTSDFVVEEGKVTNVNFGIYYRPDKSNNNLQVKSAVDDAKQKYIEANTVTTAPKPKNYKMIYLIIAIVMMLATAGGIFYYVKYLKEEDDE